MRTIYGAKAKSRPVFIFLCFCARAVQSVRELGATYVDLSNVVCTTSLKWTSRRGKLK